MIKLWRVEAFDSLNNVRVTFLIEDEDDEFAIRRARARLAPVSYGGVDLIEPYTFSAVEEEES